MTSGRPRQELACATKQPLCARYRTASQELCDVKMHKEGELCKRGRHFGRMVRRTYQVMTARSKDRPNSIVPVVSYRRRRAFGPSTTRCVRVKAVWMCDDGTLVILTRSGAWRLVASDISESRTWLKSLQLSISISLRASVQTVSISLRTGWKEVSPHRKRSSNHPGDTCAIEVPVGPRRRRILTGVRSPAWMTRSDSSCFELVSI